MEHEAHNSAVGWHWNTHSLKFVSCVLTVKMFSTEERAFLVEHVFHEGDRYTENIKMKFCLHFPNSRCPNRDTV